jgi:ribosomal protein S12 methylthiotransferase
MKQKFFFSCINLGCTKNLVDTQYLLGKLFSLGVNNPHYILEYFSDPYDKQVEIVFLNTCWFIAAGREEMKKEISKLIKAKKKVYVLWCGAQYYTTMEKSWFSFPKGSFLLSREEFEKISLHDILQGYSSSIFSDFSFPVSPVRAYTNAAYRFEYLKIAEWCNNRCSFCIIPKIRWKQKSLSIEHILDEAKKMIASGIQEIILIAQDTSRYWIDLYTKPALGDLLKQLDTLPGNFTYRLLYLYPDLLTLSQLQQLSRLQKLIPYFDIPLQHISSHLLKDMGRFYDKKAIISFLQTIKKIFPLSYIRTNIIIWFPWETQKDHQELLAFLKKGYVDQVALFEYHDEKFAASSSFPHKVDAITSRRRLTEARKLLNAQSLQQEAKRKWIQEIGYIMDIEENWIIVVRPWLHAPEIDAYDEITQKQILGTWGPGEAIAIGTKILYTVV